MNSLYLYIIDKKNLNKCTKFDMDTPRKRNFISYMEDEKLQSQQKALVCLDFMFFLIYLF